mgnify:FL=1
MPRDLHDIEEESADKKREKEQEKLAHVIKRKITHLQNEKRQLEIEIRSLKKKLEILHKQKRTFLVWWYTRKLQLKQLKLDSLNKITPSAKF